jgi:UDP-glucuronate 4-epimerase
MRFFTVYGPWGRPDMALYKFTKNIIENKKIDVFNFGNHSRDFTYFDDVVLMIKSCMTSVQLP